MVARTTDALMSVQERMSVAYKNADLSKEYPQKNVRSQQRNGAIEVHLFLDEARKRNTIKTKLYINRPNP